MSDADEVAVLKVQVAWLMEEMGKMRARFAVQAAPIFKQTPYYAEVFPANALKHSA